MQPEQQNESPPAYNNAGSIDYSQLTEAERQAEFRRQHQEYIAEKIARKKELMKLKKEQFGESSSDESQDGVVASSSSLNSIPTNKASESPKKIIPDGPIKVASKQQLNNQSVNFPITIKKGNDWVKQSINWQQKSLVIQKYSYEIKTFSKIKILTQNASYKIKLSYHQTEVLFGAGDQVQESDLPLSYYIFARIIKQRLLVAGYKLKQKNNEKIPAVPETLVKNAYIYGKILKKSQVLGKWQQRFIVINKDGIFSYKNFNEKHSMYIQSGSVKQFWTRFDIQDDLLVMKISHQSKKTEFGIPLVQTINNSNWCYYFYKMMAPTK